MDGIVGPITWEALLKILADLKLPPVSPPLTLSLRQKVLEEARKYIGIVDFSGNKPKGLDFIQKIFKEVTGWSLTENDFKDKQTGNWTWLPYIQGKPKSWCGIFGVYCYRRAGILSVGWNLTTGRPTGITTTTFSQNWNFGMKPGDIACVIHLSHHFLIEEADYSRNPHQAYIVSTIDGNQEYGRIKQRFDHQLRVDGFNYYSLIYPGWV